MALILDQSYTGTQDNATDDVFQLRRAVNNQEKLATKFVPSLTSKVTGVDLYLKKQSTPTGNIWVEIWSDSAGLPSAQIGSNSSNIDVSTLGAYGWISFTFPTPPPINAGTTYWIVYNGDYTLSTTVATQWGVTSAGTTKGARYGNGGPAWETRTEDPLFKQYRDEIFGDSAYFL